MRPRWTAGIELMHFDRTQAGRPGADSRGYWNPSRYSEARLVSAVSHEVRPFDFEARIGLGTSREIDSGGRASSGSPHLWELAVGADLAPAWRLRVALGGSGQAGGLGGSGTGYWRRWASLSVNGWF